jgi:hypothetical protein
MNMIDMMYTYYTNTKRKRNMQCNIPTLINSVNNTFVRWVEPVINSTN